MHRRLIIIIIVCANLSVDVLRQLHTALIVTESWRLPLAAYDTGAGALRMETNNQTTKTPQQPVHQSRGSFRHSSVPGSSPSTSTKPSASSLPPPINHEDADQEPISDHSP